MQPHALTAVVLNGTATVQVSTGDYQFTSDGNTTRFIISFSRIVQQPDTDHMWNVDDSTLMWNVDDSTLMWRY